MNRPWLSSPIKEAKSEKKIRAVKPAKFPIFVEASKLVEDPYWKGIFEKCGTGKFPTRFSFREDNIYYKHGTKLQSIEVPRLPSDALYVVMAFFRENSGLMSPNEIQEAQQRQAILAQTYRSPTMWKDLNQKERTLYITEYIKVVIKEMKLSQKEKDQFRRVLRGGLAIGCFSSARNNIIISQSQIIRIDGLYFDNNKRVFVIDQSLYPNTNVRYKVTPEPETNEGFSFDKAWNRYMDNKKSNEDTNDESVTD